MKSIATGPLRMEMDGGSAVPYLARTPRVPLFMLVLIIGLEAKGLLAEGEKPPKIRKKSSQELCSWELLAPPPTEKTEKIGKIKGTLVRKVPGNLRSQELVFFLGRFFCPLF